MTENDPTIATIDQTVARMEQFYRAVTGRDAPPAETEYTAIPAEKDPAEYVERRLNELLELLGAGLESARSAAAWIPPMSVWESEKEILIRLDLPGVARDQVQVTAQDNVLTVSGSRRESTDSQFRLRSRECPAGPFRRAMFVPSGLRSGEPSAEMKSGVLEIRIAKETPEAAAPKAVRVN
jgi:HSP20 family protein